MRRVESPRKQMIRDGSWPAFADFLAKGKVLREVFGSNVFASSGDVRETTIYDVRQTKLTDCARKIETSDFKGVDEFHAKIFEF